MADQSAVALLVKGLNPDEIFELQSILDYLGEKADGQQNPTGQMVEGSVASLFNRASPAVREKLTRLVEAIDTPRHLPFTPERDEKTIAGDFGLDGDKAELVKSALDNQNVMASLQARMGTDKDLPRQPPSTKDLLAAAYERHTGGN